MKKSVLLMLHLLFWIFTSLLIILVFQLLLLPAVILGGGNGPTISKQLISLLIILPIGALIFYTSYLSFGFFVRRPGRFAILTLVYIIGISGYILYDYFDSAYYNSDRVDLLGLFIVVIPILYFNSFGFLFRTFIEWIKDRKIKAELEKDRLASQLALLRSQINPHFLFNTINNIDVLIQEKPEKASEFLKKLSEILRFVLYESDAVKIPLHKEIEYIQKYIELQKIRTANKHFVKFEISGSTADKFIAPMIFIHFIENAFKFTINKKVENAINIRFNITEEKVSFICKNHSKTPEGITSEKKGLGLLLIKKRLDLIYKMDYHLNIEEEDNWYIVNLEIPLNDH